jgi:hypothetical protein
MDLLNINSRKMLIEQIESNQNKGRKGKSYRSSEIYRDNIKQYVINELREQFSEQTIKEMPISSSANICKRVVNQQATIYNAAPERTWTELSEDQQMIAWNIYHEMRVNKKLSMANKYYKLHKHCLLWMIPKEGKLVLRVLQPHQWDVVTDKNDPERAEAYIISGYDNTTQLFDFASDPDTATGRKSLADLAIDNYNQGLNLKKKEEQRDKTYLVWTAEYNYIMDAQGNYVSEVAPNPIGELPFIEVHDEKEFEYWIRSAEMYPRFTVEMNARKSEIAQIVKMQGFAQAIISGPRDMLMQNFQIGPNFALLLPKEVNGVEVTFEYAQPGSDIAGALKFLESELSLFLSSEGIDPKTITTNGESQTFTSGLERLLSLIEKMSASRADYDLFQYVESRIWELIKKWTLALQNTENLRPDLKLGAISEQSEVVVKYAQPEVVTTDIEKLDIAQRRIDMGLSSPINELMIMNDLSREQAEEQYRQFQRDMIETQDIIERDSSNDRPE